MLGLLRVLRPCPECRTVRSMTWSALPPVLVLVALGACSGRPVPPPQAAEPPPPAAPPRLEEPQPPRPPEPAPVDICVAAHTGECVPAGEFQTMAAELAEEYRKHPNFEAQWGLWQINAHRAYGYVNLLEGVDTREYRAFIPVRARVSAELSRRRG